MSSESPWKFPLVSGLDLTQGLDPKGDSVLVERGKAQTETAAILLQCLEDRPGMILGDEVGMGKTWIALLTALSVVRGGKNVLVLTPNMIIARQWEAQFLDLLHKKLVDPTLEEHYQELLTIYSDYTDIVRDARRAPARGKPGHIFVISYGKVDLELRANYRGLSPAPFGLLILDEGHNFKNELTRRYEIFHDPEGEQQGRPAVLQKQFERLLILTATPFQLGHHELQGVLKLFYAASYPDESLAAYIRQNYTLLATLQNYQSLVEEFKRRWLALDETSMPELCTLIRGEAGISDTTPHKIQDLFKRYSTLHVEKESLNEQLLQIIIRNIKSKSNRDAQDQAIDLPAERQILYFLSEQLDRANRRSISPSKGHEAALPSSYGRFQDHLTIRKTNPDSTVNFYAKLGQELFDQHYRNDPHPKLDQIADFAFQQWLAGEKTLIFCGYLKTIDELQAKVIDRIHILIEQRKKEVSFPEAELQTVECHYRLARNRECLVFRDNRIRVSLLPLLKNRKMNVDQFIELAAEDQTTLVELLCDSKLDPKRPNFKKLQAALETLYFGKYDDLTDGDIPEELKDDFEGLQSLNIWDDDLDEPAPEILEGSTEPNASISIEALTDFVTRSISTGLIAEVALYPTIWEHYKDLLERIEFEQRDQLTTLLADYLTSDEYFYLHLFPAFNGREFGADDIVSFFIKDSDTADPMHQRIDRFLRFSVDLEPRNLKRLVEDMNLRYRKNKKNPEKSILEVVDGDVGYEQKIRTVTAFKTPFAPYILISTSVLAEGVDLHTECRTIIHYDQEWNPAKLEQKNGRVDRVNCKAERVGKKITVIYPYLKNTQDEKAHHVVKARASWFNIVMGKEVELEEAESLTIQRRSLPLPQDLQDKLRMRLDNDAHRSNRKKAA